MKVYAIAEPVRRSVAVYVEVHEDSEGVRHFETLAGGAARIVEVAPGAEPPMWARVPERIAAALAEALAPRPVATERHLDDAIALRDRLLTLVEKAHDGWKP
jgi:hypothetical protein